jgi:hypothetical protein
VALAGTAGSGRSELDVSGKWLCSAQLLSPAAPVRLDVRGQVLSSVKMLITLPVRDVLR